jgi:DnaJ-class molecular chaperone
MEDYYKILGITNTASKEDIKKAYRGLSLKYHPDKNSDPNSSHKFSEINTAYEVLGDNEKRHEYDFTLNNPFMKLNNQAGSDISSDDILNLFQGLFGGNIPQGMQGNIHVFHGNNMNPFGNINLNQSLQKPIPIIKTISVSLEQIYNGTQLPVEIERFIMQNGLKLIETEILYIDIPYGTDDGEIIILRNKGNVINENIKGDLKLQIKVTNNTPFKRDGLDLIYEKTISLKESLCGFSFVITHLSSKLLTLTNGKGNIIPPEYKKIYPNLGIKRGEHIGNMIIEFHVKFPENLTKEQVTKLEEIL